MKKYENVIILICLIIFMVICTFCVVENRNDKYKNDKQSYITTEYYDEEHGQYYIIIKDKLGDVIYCEPVTMEIERK